MSIMMSRLKRVMLSPWEGADTVEYWCAHDDAQNPLFLGGREMAVQVDFCG
jgi:hypothetical protein